MAGLNSNRILKTIRGNTTFEARLKLIDQTIEAIRQSNIELKVDSYELYLIIDEAVSNAMEHGNLWKSWLEIKIIVSFTEKNQIQIAVADSGIGFEPRNLPNLKELKYLSVRGRGIPIIKKFCEVTWNVTGNIIYLLLEGKQKNGS